MSANSRSGLSLVFSYLGLRRAIGILGMAFPFVLALGAAIFFGMGVQSSMSSYYHTGMRDVFVGILWAIGFFMISYRGYKRVDDIVGDVACVFAIGVVLFPTAPDGEITDYERLIGRVHLIFAVLFFSTLTVFSLWLFKKRDKTKTPTKRKLQRNRVYTVCGCTMAACIVLMAVYSFLGDRGKELFGSLNPIYWLEALAILAFGVSWFTKGEGILKDLEKTEEGA